MKASGNLINICGFTPFEIGSYMKSCLNRMPEDGPSCIKMVTIDTEGDESEHAWIWMEGESINGFHIRAFKTEHSSDKGMSIFIPWMASGIDIYLAYAFMNAVSEKHPQAVFTLSAEDAKHEATIVDITDEARDECLLDRLNAIAMLLEMSEDSVDIPCMTGKWKMDIDKYRKEFIGIPIDKQVTRVLFDIVDFVWYQEHPELERMSED